MNISIENLNEKSFCNYTFDHNNELGRVDIFFGKNGSGKSALARYFKEKNPDSARLFDTDYVNENILTKDTISGSSIVIGNEAISTQKRINSNNKRIDEINKSEDELETKRKELREDTDSRMKEIIEIQKKKFNVNIKQKPKAKLDPQRAFDLWKNDKDIEVASSAQSIEELDLKIKKFELNSKFNSSNLEKITQEFFEQSNKLIQLSVVKPQSNINSKIIEWLRTGYELHDLNNNQSTQIECLFCGSVIPKNELIKKINKEIENDYSNLINKLNLKISIINDAIADLEEAASKIENKSISFDKPISILKQWVIILDKKKDKPDQPQVLKFYKEFAFFIKIIADEFNKNKATYENLLNEKSNIEKLAKKTVAIKICQDKDILDNLKELSNCKKQAEDYLGELKSLNEDNTKLQNSINDYAGFMKLVNEQLKLSGVDFQLEFSNNDGEFNIIVNSEQLQNRDLSEGEIRLIAFLKFYYDLFSKYKNNKGELRSDIDTIILDDPITSIDADNRIFLVEIINHFINAYITPNKDKGIIILTHSDYDFHNYGYGNSEKKYFFITKGSEKHSEIHIVTNDEMKNYSDTYRDDFYNIINFALMSRDKLNEEFNYIKYANMARFVLESHARANYELDYVTSNTLGSIMSLYNVKEEHKDEIKLMLDTINSLSHGISYINFQEPEKREVQKAIRILVTLLFLKDKEHVETMGKVPKNKKKDFSNKIKSWNYLK